MLSSSFSRNLILPLVLSGDFLKGYQRCTHRKAILVTSRAIIMEGLEPRKMKFSFRINKMVGNEETGHSS